MNLSTKITLGILSLSIIISAIAGWTVFVFTSETLGHTVAIEQEMTIEGVMRAIDRTLYERVQDIQSIAISKEIVDKIFFDEHNIAFTTNTEQTLRTVTTTSFSDHKSTHSQVLVRLKKLSVLSGPWDELKLVDATGVIDVSTFEDNESVSVYEDSELGMAHTVAMRGEVYYSDVVWNSALNRPTVIMSAPIIDEDAISSPVIGTVIGKFSWPVIGEILQAVNYDARLYNKDGVLVASSVYKEKDSLLKRSDIGHPFVISALQGQTGSQIGKNVLNTIDVLSSYTSQLGFLGYGGSGWVLIVDALERDILEQATEKAITIAGITIALLFVMALAVWLMLNALVTKRIKTFASIVENIDKDANNEMHVPIQSKDEIGRLAQSFNTMADNLIKASILPKNILASIKDALVITDKNGIITEVNQATLDITGRKKEEFVGKPFSTAMRKKEAKEKDKEAKKDV